MNFPKKTGYISKPINDRIDRFNEISADTHEDQMIILMIDDNGTIINRNFATGNLLECCVPKELIGQPISRVLPKLNDTKRFQGTWSIPKLLFLSRIGHHFEVVCMSGIRFASTLFFSDVKSHHGQYLMRVIICPVNSVSAL